MLTEDVVGDGVLDLTESTRSTMLLAVSDGSTTSPPPWRVVDAHRLADLRHDDVPLAMSDCSNRVYADLVDRLNRSQVNDLKSSARRTSARWRGSPTND